MSALKEGTISTELLKKTSSSNVESRYIWKQFWFIIYLYISRIAKRAEYRGENICPSQKHIRYAPRAPKNKHGKWVFIANSFKTEEDFEILQVVDFEICQVDEKHECSVDIVSVRHTCKIFVLLSLFIFYLQLFRLQAEQNGSETNQLSSGHRGGCSWYFS